MKEFQNTGFSITIVYKCDNFQLLSITSNAKSASMNQLFRPMTAFWSLSTVSQALTVSTNNEFLSNRRWTSICVFKLLQKKHTAYLYDFY